MANSYNTILQEHGIPVCDHRSLREEFARRWRHVHEDDPDVEYRGYCPICDQKLRITRTAVTEIE